MPVALSSSPGGRSRAGAFGHIIASILGAAAAASARRARGEPSRILQVVLYIREFMRG